MAQIREATVNDMKELLDFMTKYHEKSNMGDVPIDRPSLVKLVEYYIAARDSLALAAFDQDGTVHGVLFGSLEPFFFNPKKFYGTDLFFFAKGSGPALWKRFIAWAFGAGADRVIMGVSSGDERADQLLEVLGMNKTGGMYELRR